MDRHVDGSVVWWRALVAASLAFFLGVAGHVTAGGLLPGLLPLAVLFVVGLGFSLALLTRPVGLPTMLVLMVGGQAGVHAMLSLGAGHVGHRPSPARATTGSGAADLPTVDGRRVGSLMDAYHAATPAPGRAGEALSAGPVAHLVQDLAAQRGMAVLHLAAAVLVAMWLAHGERLLWSLVALLGRHLRLATAAPVPVPRPAPRPRGAEWFPAPYALLAQPILRRGPPVLV